MTRLSDLEEDENENENDRNDGNDGFCGDSSSDDQDNEGGQLDNSKDSSGFEVGAASESSEEVLLSTTGNEKEVCHSSASVEAPAPPTTGSAEGGHAGCGVVQSSGGGPVETMVRRGNEHSQEDSSDDGCDGGNSGCDNEIGGGTDGNIHGRVGGEIGGSSESGKCSGSDGEIDCNAGLLRLVKDADGAVSCNAEESQLSREPTTRGHQQPQPQQQQQQRKTEPALEMLLGESPSRLQEVDIDAELGEPRRKLESGLVAECGEADEEETMVGENGPASCDGDIQRKEYVRARATKERDEPLTSASQSGDNNSMMLANASQVDAHLLPASAPNHDKRQEDRSDEQEAASEHGAALPSQQLPTPAESLNLTPGIDAPMAPLITGDGIEPLDSPLGTALLARKAERGFR